MTPYFFNPFKHTVHLTLWKEMLVPVISYFFAAVPSRSLEVNNTEEVQLVMLPRNCGVTSLSLELVETTLLCLTVTKL